MTNLVSRSAASKQATCNPFYRVLLNKSMYHHTCSATYTIALATTATALAAAYALNGTTEEILLEVSDGNATNGTGSGLGECGSAWIGTIVSAGLFIVSEALPFISKTPSNGVLHTIINGIKGLQKK